ncbi:glycosyltransferase family 4 protein [Magnetospirillum sp. 15-1]|uniref:glycosyltransferase family 4 protein n=1 Tax=Magnetospirillum sp. 15-1 TaxID=1979370 RepID=UPI001142C454|nr:glycosyltransferase family 4 protein [Magnetospirillum sp. 15-1]
MPFAAAASPARRAGLPRPLRLALIGWNYGVEGGVFSDWTRATQPLWPILAEHFRPDVVWGTFGNTDAWKIAQGVARAAGSPWVADIKDAWDIFIPAPLRPLLAWRYGDCAGLTGLSAAHLAHTGKHFSQPRQTVFSGFPAALLDHADDSDQPARRITVTGSLYSEAGAEAVAEGVRLWLARAGRQARAKVVFTYAGGDRNRMERAAGRLDGLCRLDIRGFLPLAELVGLQRGAFLNLYARHTGSADSFHHKLLELMAVGRPVACIPEEIPEALALAEAAGGRLSSCADPATLALALDRAWEERDGPPVADRDRLAGFTWDAQAERLEEILMSAQAAAPCGYRLIPVLASVWIAGIILAYLRQFLDMAPAILGVLR